MQPRLLVDNLTKTFGAQYALDKISFKVNTGEILGFLGPNGAGKSTMMKIATGYLLPSSGSVQVCGLDVQENPHECRKRIGYLPEHNPLYEDLYIKEYLEFTAELHGLKSGYAESRIKEMIHQCGLEPERKKKIRALSKGYRQRMGLAQALLHEPEVLILDEPTSGLDPNQLSDIRELIKETGKHTTIIFSTHILQEAEALCDRLIIIHKGKIKEDIRLSDLHKRFTSGITIAGFSSPVESKHLKEINGVVSVEVIGNNRFRIFHDKNIDFCSLISSTASEHRWVLNELTTDKQSLEDIFRKLTASGD